MAEGHRMTAAREVVEELLRSQHADVLGESVAFMVRELIEAELAARIGAEHGERAPERRTSQRNGYEAGMASARFSAGNCTPGGRPALGSTPPGRSRS